MLGNGLDADAGGVGEVYLGVALGVVVLEPLQELGVVFGAFSEFDARVDVFRIFADDDHVNVFRVFLVAGYDF